MYEFTKLSAYRELKKHALYLSDLKISDLFKEDASRADTFSIEFENLTFDFSKNLIDKKAFEFLIKLAKLAKIEEKIKDMFQGEHINTTEDRAVLHIALRASENSVIKEGKKNIMPEVYDTLKKMEYISSRIRNGEYKGYSGKKIIDVVNIGIGGSDLGPKMACNALYKYRKPGINVHFVSNVDGTDLKKTLMKCSPETTIFIIASKSFTTDETLTNANTAREWLINSLGKNAIGKHFFAISTNLKLAKEFGINADNVLSFGNYIGGRFSMWGPIGLPIAIAVGMDNFKAMLSGAHKIDNHFLTSDLEENIPVILGLIGIWNINFLNQNTLAILPYDESLSLLPSYLQQLEMESNGKAITKNGTSTDYATAPVIFGEAGTNGQHSFYQLLHQGTNTIPSDFIAFAKSNFETNGHHIKLLANFTAQTQALMEGKSKEQVKSELIEKGYKGTELTKLIPHKIFNGNRSSNSFLFNELTPETLGQLIAIYEHKVFTQGIIWNINSFDQFGVELGKQLAKKTFADLKSEEIKNEYDSSSKNLIEKIKKIRN